MARRRRRGRRGGSVYFSGWFAVDKKRAAEAMSRAAVRLVRASVDQGKGANGRRLRRYTKRYRERKRKAGKQVSPPDLRWTGSMLDELGMLPHRTTGKRVKGKIGLRTKENRIKAATLSKRRKWLGLTNEQIGKVAQELERARLIKRTRGQ